MSSGQFPGWPDDPVKTPEVSGDPSEQINPDALGPAPRIAAPSVQVSLPEVAAVDGHDELHRPPPNRSNPLLGVLGGLLGAVAGGTVFGAISAMVVLYVGLVPLAVVGAGTGFFAGWGIRLLCRSVTWVYGVAGACLALLGTVWGNLFWIAFNWTLDGRDAAFAKVFSAPLQYLDAGFGAWGLLGYPVAAAVGFFSAFRRAGR